MKPTTSLTYPVRQVIPTSIAHRYGMFSRLAGWISDVWCAVSGSRASACAQASIHRAPRAYRRRLPPPRATVIKTHTVGWQWIALSACLVGAVLVAGTYAAIYLEHSLR